ncbi:MAG: hypothetical protein JNL70_18340 [Saprospiraceae bacterium]|nr:hypothetical protein [Saprospiraceae bacterium]
MTSLTEQYAQKEHYYESLRQKETQKANAVAAFRLVTILSLLFGVYHYFNAQDWVALAIAVGVLGLLFFILVFYHAHLKEQEQLFAHLVKINQDEQAYLQGDLTPFDAGETFINPEHPYTYDLDMFGATSIYQHLNRTATVFGRATLAEHLGHPEADDILLRQEAIKELAQNVDWRQYFQARGQMFAAKEANLDRFKDWLAQPLPMPNRTLLRVLSFVLPALTVLSLILMVATDMAWASTAFKGLGILNLLIVGSQQKIIKAEHQLLTHLSLAFQKYAALLKAIEHEPFAAHKLQQLKQTTLTEGATASTAMKRLSVILNQFDSIFNAFAALVSNGLLQYHIHTLFSLDKWKQQFGQNVGQWFYVLGEFESLASVANFAYNHPEFIFPTPNTEGELVMTNVGHPLISENKRIGNDIRFNDPSFVVLTGSNMSGKSTFLRTLGVNLVLAKMGAPVCATEFRFFPFHVFVSMRVSDSLQNSESFFFAELKRLKRIITELEENQKTFVILDEILRGTNSNDKRAGTIGLIHNLMAHKAVGIIATHDLMIGDMEKDFPEYLKNRCFEVEIGENELHFDYKLKEGVAQKMSAAFLMQKMGIIR